MRALVHDPDAPEGLRLGEAPAPEPGPAEVLVEVAATSLNFADVAFLRERVMRAGGTRIEAFTVGPGFAADLPYLVSLLEAGELDPRIGWRGSWDRASEAAAALMGRRVRGKAVLEVAA